MRVLRRLRALIFLLSGRDVLSSGARSAIAAGLISDRTLGRVLRYSTG
jgi:hypothetical protein